jgi:L-threonylcarbamoyladenylate synthase
MNQRNPSMTETLDCAELPRRDLASNISKGATVVFPTDTVYGLGSNPRSPEGARKCFVLKGRQTGKPMPVLFSSIEPMIEFVKVDHLSRSLGERFWPGALTIVLPLREGALLAPEVTCGGGTLAARIPNHRCCLFLISSCGGSLIGTSANVSGEPPPTDPEDPKLLGFSKVADYFIKGPCGEANMASTVVDMTNSQPRILREGAISKEELLSHFEKTSKTDFSAKRSAI